MESYAGMVEGRQLVGEEPRETAWTVGQVDAAAVRICPDSSTAMPSDALSAAGTCPHLGVVVHGIGRLIHKSEGKASDFGPMRRRCRPPSDGPVRRGATDDKRVEVADVSRRR